jgi:hypothetical protein
MKMAKASAADLDMAMTVGNYLDAIDRGHMPDDLSVDKESIEYLDSDDCEQYARLIRGFQNLLGKGSICRVIWGMCVVCDPENTCIDPDADTIEIHPDHIKAHEQRDELLAALTEYLAAADNSVSPENDDDIAAMLRYADAEKDARAVIAKYRNPGNTACITTGK